MTKKVTFNVDFPTNLKKDTSLSSTPRLAFDDLGDFIEERTKIRRLLDNANETALKIDYSDFANHVFFDSAVSKYLVAQDRILTKYPYNGNKEEKDAYFLTGSGYENYLFEQWPRYVGYVEFSSSAQFISASDYNKKLVFNTSSLMMSVDINTRQQTGVSNMICAISSTQASYQLYLSGTTPSLVVGINSGSTTAALVVDYSQYLNTWHNVASVFDRDAGTISAYIDGNKIASQSFNPGPMEQSNITVYVGGNTAAGYSSFSGCLDNVRLYFTSSELLLQKSIGKSVDSENYLALNYTFSEGKVFTASVDSNVIDYSKNGLHGLIAGYTDNVRVSGTSRFSDSSWPILYSFHGDVIQFSGSQVLSASLYDADNNNQITNMISEGVLLADEAQEGLMMAFSLALARFFDEIKLYIDQFENLRVTNYDNIDETPDQFLPFLTRYFGWKVTEHFNDADPLSFFFGEGVKTNQTMELPLVQIRNQFWRRILNNLPYLLKTKGKRYNLDAFFNVIGLNKENINLKEYGYLSEGSIDDTRIHKEKVSAFLGIGTGSLSSSFVKIPSAISASNNSFTVEAWLQGPYFSSSYRDNLSVLTGSVWQMTDPLSGSYSLLWNVASLGNTLGKFILTGSDGQQFSSSNVEVFDGDFVYVAAGLKSDQIPFIEIRTLDNDELDLEATFSGSIALSGVFTGSKFDFIMGASSGSFFQHQTQGFYGQYKLWSRALSSSEITTHAFDFENVGIFDPLEKPNPLLGYWPLIENVSASIGGIINGIQDLSRNDRIGTGSNFPISYNSYKKFLVEYNTLSPSFDLRWTENKIRVRNKTELTINDIAHDTNEVSLEFNFVDALNKDISKIFATFDLFNNAIGNPINKYRDEYADLEAYRRVYFERLGDSLHFNQFFGLFKWFDKKISDAIKQLLPARVRFIGGEQVIESHALERPRYQYKYPIFRTPVDLPNIDLSGVLSIDAAKMRNYESDVVLGTSNASDYEKNKLNVLRSNRVIVSPESHLGTIASEPASSNNFVSIYDQGSSFLGSKNPSVNQTSIEVSMLSGGFSPNTPQMDLLPRVLTINSTSVSNEFLYVGRQGSSTTWPAAIFSASWPTLQSTGSGNAMSGNQETPLLTHAPFDASIRFSGSNTGLTADGNVGQCFAAVGSASFANLAIEDFCIEALFSYQESAGFGASPKAIMTKADPTGNPRGWYLVQNAWDGLSTSRDISFLVGDGTNWSGTTYNSKAAPRAWYHVMVFADRSETISDGLRMFVNGQEVESVTNLNGLFQNITSITSSFPLVVGGYSDAQRVHHGNIGMISMWKQTNWFAGTSQNILDWKKIASNRFARINGTVASVDVTTNGQPEIEISVSASRETPAYITKYNNGTGSLVIVGQNWPRMGQHIDASGSVVTGYVAESGTLNWISGASEISSSWRITNAGTVNLISSGTFNKIPAYSFIGLGTGTTSKSFFLTSTLSPPATSVTVISVFARKLDPNVPWLYISTLENLFNTTWFNLHSGTFTSSFANIKGIMQDYGNGWYRCTQIHNWPGGVPQRAIFGISTASFNVNTVINGLTGALIAGPTWELERSYPSSYFTDFVDNGNTGSLRATDSLIYSSSYAFTINSLSVKELAMSATNMNSGPKYMLTLQDGNTSNHRIQLYLTGGTSDNKGKYYAEIHMSGGNPRTRITSSMSLQDSSITQTLEYRQVNLTSAIYVNGDFQNQGVPTLAGGHGVPLVKSIRVAPSASFNGLLSDVNFVQDFFAVNAFFPIQVNGNNNVDKFASNVDINSRNELARSTLLRQDQNDVTEIGNSFVRKDFDSCVNNEHYFLGNTKHLDLKFAALSGNTLEGNTFTLAGANEIELSSTLMDANNVLIISPVRPGALLPHAQTFNVTQVFGYPTASGHELFDAHFKFSISASVGAFAASDIGVEFRDFSSSTWSSYTHIGRLGIYQSSSVPGWLNFEYNFAKNGKISWPKMSYVVASGAFGASQAIIRLSSSTGKTYVFKDVRIEFKEALTNTGVVFYQKLDNQSNKDNFTYINEKILKDVEN